MAPARGAAQRRRLDLYRYLLRRHLRPTFGNVAVAAITEAHVRRWRKELLDSGVSVVTAAKAYRLLKAIMNTAADDGLIRRNPCRIKGAGREMSPERPVLTIGQVYALSAAIDQRYRALVLLGTFSSLRWGELAGLRRCDIDLAGCTVEVKRSLTERSGGSYFLGPPKSEAGRRRVVFPDVIVPDLQRHLAKYAQPEADGLVFTSPGGVQLRQSNFPRRVWAPALAKVGLPGVRFHDLRHTGNTLTAGAGANLRELMERMGHSSARAAMIYLHATGERQRQIADALGELARTELASSQKPRRGGKASGTQRGRRRRNAS